MKKFSYLLSVILPVALLMSAGNVNAQLKNDNNKDVKVDSAIPQRLSPLDKKIADIGEDYNEALSKLNKSSFNEAKKKMLGEQLQENREFAIKTAREKNAMRMKHWKVRQDMREELKNDKSKRKILQEIDDID